MIRFIGLFDTAGDYNLQFLFTQKYSSVYSHVFTSRCSVTTSNSGRSPSSLLPNYLRFQLQASHSNSSQRLNLSTSLTNSLTNSATHQPAQLTLTILLIISLQGQHRKHIFSVAVQLLLSCLLGCPRDRYSAIA
jgi:hypothetical protein